MQPMLFDCLSSSCSADQLHWRTARLLDSQSPLFDYNIQTFELKRTAEDVESLLYRVLDDDAKRLFGKNTT